MDADRRESGAALTEFDQQLLEQFQIDPTTLSYDSNKPFAENGTRKLYFGTWDGSICVIKSTLWELRPDLRDKQLREVFIPLSLCHPNVLRPYGWADTEDYMLLVMPLCKEGNLMDVLKRAPVDPSMGEYPQALPFCGGVLGWSRFFTVVIGIAKGLNYLATRTPKPIVHRDLKPQNVLMSDRDQPLICDFGSTRRVGAATMEGGHQTFGDVTYAYAAPEFFGLIDAAGSTTKAIAQADKGLKPKADVFSFGVMLWQLLYFHPERCRGVYRVKQDGSLAEAKQVTAYQLLEWFKWPLKVTNLQQVDGLPRVGLLKYGDTSPITLLHGIISQCTAIAAEERPSTATLVDDLNSVYQLFVSKYPDLLLNSPQTPSVRVSPGTTSLPSPQAATLPGSGNNIASAALRPAPGSGPGTGSDPFQQVSWLSAMPKHGWENASNASMFHLRGDASVMSVSNQPSTHLTTHFAKDVFDGNFILNDTYWVQAKPFGKGSFGKVYQGTFEPDPDNPPNPKVAAMLRPGMRVAIKVLDDVEKTERKVRRFGKRRAGAGGAGRSPGGESDGGNQLATGFPFQREIAQLKKLRNRHIVPLIEAIYNESEDQYLLVMPFMGGGTMLAKHPEKLYRYVPLIPSMALRYLRQVASALYYLHNKKQIVHRDVKPENVLLDDEGNARLADFGESELFGSMNGYSFKGTPQFMAPELWTLGDGNGGSPEACSAPSVQQNSDDPFFNSPEKEEKGPEGAPLDVWALGVTFFCAFFGRYPFPDEGLSQLTKIGEAAKTLVSATRASETLPEIAAIEDFKLRKDILYVLDGMLQKSPDQRWSVAKVLVYVLKKWPETKQENVEATKRLASAARQPFDPSSDESGAEQRDQQRLLGVGSPKLVSFSQSGASEIFDASITAEDEADAVTGKVEFKVRWSHPPSQSLGSSSPATTTTGTSAASGISSGQVSGASAQSPH